MPQENLHNEFFLYFNIFMLKQSKPIIKAQIISNYLITQSPTIINIYDITLNETVHDTVIKHM